jgi:hypothetical protein
MNAHNFFDNRALSGVLDFARGPASLLAGCFLIFSVLTACRTVERLPALDLQEPGWRVRQGQGLWQPGRGQPEIAGELLVALHPEGRLFVQFSKAPFPLVLARKSAGLWQVEFLPQRRAISGKGEPPKRFVWFQVARALSGEQPPAPWFFEQLNGKTWRLQNRLSGEMLEGYLSP